MTLQNPCFLNKVNNALTLVLAQKWTDFEPGSVRTFIKGFALTLSFYDFDKSLHSLIRTSNALERPFREFRNKAIGAFPKWREILYEDLWIVNILRFY